MFFIIKDTGIYDFVSTRGEMYRFHPGVTDACKQKIFHTKAKSHNGRISPRGETMRVNYPLDKYF